MAKLPSVLQKQKSFNLEFVRADKQLLHQLIFAVLKQSKWRQAVKKDVEPKFTNFCFYYIWYNQWYQLLQNSSSSLKTRLSESSRGERLPWNDQINSHKFIQQNTAPSVSSPKKFSATKFHMNNFEKTFQRIVQNGWETEPRNYDTSSLLEGDEKLPSPKR